MASGAEVLKARGNAHYLAGEIEDAIECYSKAIVARPDVATYHSNRALCHLKLRRWERVVTDCEAAISLDPDLFKAHFFLGNALLELNEADRAVEKLTKAYELAYKRDVVYAAEISELLLQAKRKRWEDQEGRRLAAASDNYRYLQKLVLDDAQRLMKECNSPAERDALEQTTKGRLGELQSLYEKASEGMVRREIPEFMFSNISFEPLRDPVITPSGVTYERESILQHLRRVGEFDPVSRTHLSEKQLVPNLVMREVIEYFMAKNGWANEF